MSRLVCLVANTLYYPEGGGHRWAYLNWALGVRAAGCRVVWLECLAPGRPAEAAVRGLAALRRDLAPVGLAESIALAAPPGARLPASLAGRALDLDAAAEADLLLDAFYGTPGPVVRRFRRSALLDLDPGLLQLWMAQGKIETAPHDVYFTVGEAVQGGGPEWVHVPRCVALDFWPPAEAGPSASFTAVSHWFELAWIHEGGETYRNDKRGGFLPFADLPSRTRVPLELALCLGPGDAEDRAALVRRGWRVRDAHEVAGSAEDYRHYLLGSLGEFGWTKPAYARLGHAWLSDRTVCYLSAGKPAVVRHTGPSRVLPDADGLFRYRDVDEAASALERIAADYATQARRARALAEASFDARAVATRLLERAIP